MRKIRSTVAVAAMAVAALTIVAVPAHAADTETCVTKAEFRKVQKGWGITRVHRLFDIKGHQTFFSGAIPELDIPAEQWREYRACQNPKFSTIEVDFEKHKGVWKVSNKFAVWF